MTIREAVHTAVGMVVGALLLGQVAGAPAPTPEPKGYFAVGCYADQIAIWTPGDRDHVCYRIDIMEYKRIVEMLQQNGQLDKAVHGEG